MGFPYRDAYEKGTVAVLTYTGILTDQLYHWTFLGSLGVIVAGFGVKFGVFGAFWGKNGVFQDELPSLPRPHPALPFLGPEAEDLEDLYSRYKKLQQELQFLEVQEEYIKDEQKNLKKEFLHAQEEVKRIQSIPLVIGQFLEAVDQNTAIVGSTTGSNYYVRILSTIDRELLKPNASVALHKHSNALVDVLPPEADSSIMMLSSGMGGRDPQIWGGETPYMGWETPYMGQGGLGDPLYGLGAPYMGQGGLGDPLYGL
ncbi:26S proteasome regulatory subunit 6B-like [Coturnix japonica]|uniref:26S proteasome regulatory subunit 6B-like n=1 Tax=Coturnix japonica TaxID=93934 RepID=UPI0007774E6D|nr:26S proteasome regulatory subunit 6B-like [Coturnix japonica]